MTDTQHRAIAAGFLHALHTTPALFAEWNTIPKDNASAIGALIQKTMGLSQAPTTADIQAMAKYIDAQLQSQVDSIKSLHADAPHNVGFLILMQQNS